MDIERTFDLFNANIRSNANHIKSNGTCTRFESNQIRAPDSNRIVWGPRSLDWFDSHLAGGGSGVDCLVENGISGALDLKNALNPTAICSLFQAPTCQHGTIS